MSVALEGDVAGTSGSGVKQREVDPSWEPNDITLTLYVTRSFGLALDQVAAKLRLSKSLLLREAVRRGLPELVNDVEHLRGLGFRPAAHLAGLVARRGRRGAVGEGAVTARWSKVPGSSVSGSWRENPRNGVQVRRACADT